MAGYTSGSVIGLITFLTALTVAVVTPYVGTGIYFKKMSPRVVSTPFGEFRGILREFPGNSSLRPVHVYLGLEYASLLGGSLRFLPPGSPIKQKWEGSRVITKFKKACPQRLIRPELLDKSMAKEYVERLKRLAAFVQDQTEDCLSLNIYVPSKGEYIYVCYTCRCYCHFATFLIWQQGLRHTSSLWQLQHLRVSSGLLQYVYWSIVFVNVASTPCHWLLWTRDTRSRFDFTFPCYLFRYKVKLLPPGILVQRSCD